MQRGVAVEVVVEGWERAVGRAKGELGITAVLVPCLLRHLGAGKFVKSLSLSPPPAWVWIRGKGNGERGTGTLSDRQNEYGDREGRKKREKRGGKVKSICAQVTKPEANLSSLKSPQKHASIISSPLAISQPVPSPV